MIYLVSESHRYGCPQDIPNGKCIGDRCAAWRWHDDLMRWTALSIAAEEEPERPTHVPASWKWSPASENGGVYGIWVEPVSEAMRRRRGYCGLAGKPEVIE